MIFNQIVDICFADIVNEFYGEVGYFERLDALSLTGLIKIPAVFVPFSDKENRPGALSIQPEIPEILVRNQMERTISVRSEGKNKGAPNINFRKISVRKTI